ncbi:oxidoreductase [Xylariales sp. AK1849]|nr:oxidoreductase [Xylariales sp. AK1849]
MLGVLTCIVLAITGTLRAYIPRHMTLPTAPGLPDPIRTGYVNVTNGIDIWFAQFGPSLEVSFASHRTPVLFLHGAHASSDYWGNQIEYLLCQDEPSTILAIDSRLMGRSTYGDMSTSFDQKADDTVAVLDYFGISKAAVVGWSNGAVVLINLLQKYPARIDRAFVFAGGFDADTSINRTTDTAQHNATSAIYFNRTLEELLRLSVKPELVPAARQAYFEEFQREPHWASEDFAKIPTPIDDCEGAPVVWYVEGAEEEVVNQGVARTMHEWTPGSGLVVLPDASHFALLQDPDTFNIVLGRFLQYGRQC